MEKIADSESEWQHLLRGESNQFIRSREQWDFLINRDIKPPIISKLETHLTEISKQLVFSKDGLAQAEHRVKEFSEQDFLELLTLFGIGPQLARASTEEDEYCYNFSCRTILPTGG